MLILPQLVPLWLHDFWRTCVLLSGSKREGRGVKMKRLCFGREKKLRWRLVKKDRMV